MNGIDQDNLSEFIADTMKGSGIPGAVVGVLHQGEVITTSYGVTSVENPLPVTDETLFQIGSITKTFTGTAIMRLIETGKLDLEATVRTYVPAFRVTDEEAASQVTIRHLLTHTAGWDGDFASDTGAGDDALEKYVASMAELEQLVPLGTLFSYNNTSFALAGYIVEVVTGKSYQSALKELILDPLGMKNSYLESGDVMVHRFAVGHITTSKGVRVSGPWPLPRWAWPAGGITCDVHDLLRYARFHLGDGRTQDGTRLLSAESMARMRTPEVTIREDESLGLSWSIDGKEGRRVMWHAGGTNGQVALLVLAPENDFAIAILTNSNWGESVYWKVAGWALNRCLGIEIPQPTAVESTEEELVQYAGRYVEPYQDIELDLLEGRLVGQVIYKRGPLLTKDTKPPAAFPLGSLVTCGKDRLMVAGGPLAGLAGWTADIVRRPDGSIGWLRFGRRIHIRETES